MKHKRIKVLASAAAFAIGASIAAAPAHAQAIRALVTGANTYPSMDSTLQLRGAVNDAQSITAALKTARAAEVVTLLEGQVKKAAIRDTLKRLSAASQPGDWLVFAYAGHGGQKPDSDGDDSDGRDETYLLPGGESETIVDDEMFQWLSEIPQNINVIVVLDACNSGTMTRNADKAYSGPMATRFVPSRGAAAPRSGSPPREGKDLNSNVIVVTAVKDGVLSPEFPDKDNGGKIHGALSLAFSKAIRGEADVNGDGTQFLELRSFIRREVRRITDDAQLPEFDAERARQADVNSEARMRTVTIPFARTIGPRPVIETMSVFVTGGAQSAITGVPHASAAASKEAADLVWAKDRGGNVYRDGNMVAQAVASPQAFADVVEKWLGLRRIRAAETRGGLDADLCPNGAGQTYQMGARVRFDVKLPTNANGVFVTAMNFANDGALQPLHGHDAASSAKEYRDFSIASIEVRDPPGADHAVIVTSQAEPTALRALMKGSKGRTGAAVAAARQIEAMVKAGQASVAVVPLYTAPRGQIVAAGAPVAGCR